MSRALSLFPSLRALTLSNLLHLEARNKLPKCRLLVSAAVGGCAQIPFESLANCRIPTASVRHPTKTHTHNTHTPTFWRNHWAHRGVPESF